jgi:hypothetical protein
VTEFVSMVVWGHHPSCLPACINSDVLVAGTHRCTVDEIPCTKRLKSSSAAVASSKVWKAKDMGHGDMAEVVGIVVWSHYRQFSVLFIIPMCYVCMMYACKVAGTHRNVSIILYV